MEAEKKKTKYIQKSKVQHVEKKINETTNKPENKQKQEENPTYKQQTLQNMIKNKPEPKTKVINVKVQNLRKMGYKSLLDWLEDPNHVYVGRHNHYVPGATASIWQNPFKVNQFGRDECIQRYKEYLLKNEKLMPQIKTLKGKVLGCWCAPQNCHGFVLAEVADSIKE